MVRKECRFPGCKCNEGLREVTRREEAFCCVLMEVQKGWDGFSCVPDSGKFKSHTWLCEDHTPDGLDGADLIGERVAKLVGGQLFFGEVTEVSGFSRETRQLDRRVAQLLAQHQSEWLYTVKWPAATSYLTRETVIQARDDAASIDRHVTAELTASEKQHKRDYDAAWHRGQRAGAVRDPTPRTRYVVPTYEGMLSAVPPSIRRFLPTYQPSPHIVGSFTTETPVGTIHHSGTGLLFDINAMSKAQQTTGPVGFSFECLEADYLSEHDKLVHDCFGFADYDALEHFFVSTWGMEPDEPGVSERSPMSAFHEYLLTLWRMRKRQDLTFLGAFAGVNQQRVSEIQFEWYAPALS